MVSITTYSSGGAGFESPSGPFFIYFQINLQIKLKRLFVSSYYIVQRDVKTVRTHLSLAAREAFRSIALVFAKP